MSQSETLFGLEKSEVNHVTYHVLETVAVHSTITPDELEVKEYYNHAYISGPKAEQFVDQFCDGTRGSFEAKLKKSPLLDEAEHYHYAIK
jgi:hypothetical protein